jgi:hypothetical protein
MIFRRELKWGPSVRRRDGKFTERPLGADRLCQVSVSMLRARNAHSLAVSAPCLVQLVPRGRR